MKVQHGARIHGRCGSGAAVERPGAGDAARASGRDIFPTAGVVAADGTEEPPVVGWEKIIEHIDHVVKLVGPDHVGLGSDFDGASMPEGMDDCSKLPKITEALVGKGYSEVAIRKILGENLLRVMEQNERVCREMQGTEHQSDHS